MLRLHALALTTLLGIGCDNGYALDLAVGSCYPTATSLSLLVTQRPSGRPTLQRIDKVAPDRYLRIVALPDTTEIEVAITAYDMADTQVGVHTFVEPVVGSGIAHRSACAE